VNSFIRGLAIALLGLGILAAPGCSTDNETETEKLSKGMGDPGAKASTEKKPAAAVDNNPDARSARLKNVSDQKKAMQGPAYPKN